MRIPREPALLPLQRTKKRFFDTGEMMDILSIYHGTRRPIYRRTWKYRTMIIVHRAQHSTNMYRKGYGPDWKSLRRVEKSGVMAWEEDGGMSIKKEVLEYSFRGVLPLAALQRSSELILEAEMNAVVALRVKDHLAERSRGFLAPIRRFIATLV